MTPKYAVDSMSVEIGRRYKGDYKINKISPLAILHACARLLLEIPRKIRRKRENSYEKSFRDVKCDRYERLAFAVDIRDGNERKAVVRAVL